MKRFDRRTKKETNGRNIVTIFVCKIFINILYSLYFVVTIWTQLQSYNVMAFHDIISNLFALKINIELIRATSLQMPKEFFPNKNDFFKYKIAWNEYLFLFRFEDCQHSCKSSGKINWRWNREMLEIFTESLMAQTIFLVRNIQLKIESSLSID